MNGALLPHTPIAVDFWRVRQCPEAKVFFLTHLHGDHISGLTPSWSRPIYCTPITKKLLMQKLQIREELIHDLAINATHVVKLDEEEKETMSVTVIDAHHCPGSAMFLFQGYFGTILHTGDFRYTEKMFIDSPLSTKRTVDVLYLDNTYSSPECEFPTRRQAMEEVFEILDKHPDHQVLVGMRSLGKEDLLVAMALHIQTWVVVSAGQYELLQIMDMPNVFTTDRWMGRIHVIPVNHLNSQNLQSWNKQHPTIGLIPTALYQGHANPYQFQPGIYLVPYSDHSSYSELHRFVEKVRPKKIVPIVVAKTRGPYGQDISERSQMRVYRKYMNLQSIAPFKIPRSVEKYMKENNFDVNDGEGNSRKRKHPQGSMLGRKRPRVPMGVLYDEEDWSEGSDNSRPSTLKSDYLNTYVYHQQREQSRLQRSPEGCFSPESSPQIQDEELEKTKSISDSSDGLEPQTTYVPQENPPSSPNTKPTRGWKLIPVTVPPDKQPIWSTIGDPLWYFQNIVKKIVEDNPVVEKDNEPTEISDIPSGVVMDSLESRLRFEFNVNADYGPTIESPLPPDLMELDVDKLSAIHNPNNSVPDTKRECQSKRKITEDIENAGESLPLYSSRTPLSSRSTPCPSDCDDFINNDPHSNKTYLVPLSAYRLHQLKKNVCGMSNEVLSDDQSSLHGETSSVGKNDSIIPSRDLQITKESGACQVQVPGKVKVDTQSDTKCSSHVDRVNVALSTEEGQHPILDNVSSDDNPLDSNSNKGIDVVVSIPHTNIGNTVEICSPRVMDERTVEKTHLKSPDIEGTGGHRDDTKHLKVDTNESLKQVEFDTQDGDRLIRPVHPGDGNVGQITETRISPQMEVPDENSSHTCPTEECKDVSENNAGNTAGESSACSVQINSELVVTSGTKGAEQLGSDLIDVPLTEGNLTVENKVVSPKFHAKQSGIEMKVQSEGALKQRVVLETENESRAEETAQNQQIFGVEGTAQNKGTLNAEGTFQNKGTLGIEETAKNKQTLGVEGTTEGKRTLGMEGIDQEQKELCVEKTAQKKQTLNVEGTAQNKETLGVDEIAQSKNLRGDGTAQKKQTVDLEGGDQNKTTLGIGVDRTAEDKQTLGVMGTDKAKTTLGIVEGTTQNNKTLGAEGSAQSYSVLDIGETAITSLKPLEKVKTESSLKKGESAQSKNTQESLDNPENPAPKVVEVPLVESALTVSAQTKTSVVDCNKSSAKEKVDNIASLVEISFGSDDLSLSDDDDVYSIDTTHALFKSESSPKVSIKTVKSPRNKEPNPVQNDSSYYRTVIVEATSTVRSTGQKNVNTDFDLFTSQLPPEPVHPPTPERVAEDGQEGVERGGTEPSPSFITSSSYVNPSLANVRPPLLYVMSENGDTPLRDENEYFGDATVILDQSVTSYERLNYRSLPPVPTFRSFPDSALFEKKETSPDEERCSREGKPGTAMDEPDNSGNNDTDASTDVEIRQRSVGGYGGEKYQSARSWREENLDLKIESFSGGCPDIDESALSDIKKQKTLTYIPISNDPSKGESVLGEVSSTVSDLNSHGEELMNQEKNEEQEQINPDQSIGNLVRGLSLMNSPTVDYSILKTPEYMSDSDSTKVISSSLNSYLDQPYSLVDSPDREKSTKPVFVHSILGAASKDKDPEMKPSKKIDDSAENKTDPASRLKVIRGSRDLDKGPHLVNKTNKKSAGPNQEGHRRSETSENDLIPGQVRDSLLPVSSKNIYPTIASSLSSPNINAETVDFVSTVQKTTRVNIDDLAPQPPNKKENRSGSHMEGQKLSQRNQILEDPDNTRGNLQLDISSPTPSGTDQLKLTSNREASSIGRSTGLDSPGQPLCTNDNTAQNTGGLLSPPRTMRVSTLVDGSTQGEDVVERTAKLMYICTVQKEAIEFQELGENASHPETVKYLSDLESQSCVSDLDEPCSIVQSTDSSDMNASLFKTPAPRVGRMPSPASCNREFERFLLTRYSNVSKLIQSTDESSKSKSVPKVGSDLRSEPKSINQPRTIENKCVSGIQNRDLIPTVRDDATEPFVPKKKRDISSDSFPKDRPITSDVTENLTSQSESAPSDINSKNDNKSSRKMPAGTSSKYAGTVLKKQKQEKTPQPSSQRYHAIRPVKKNTKDLPRGSPKQQTSTPNIKTIETPTEDSSKLEKGSVNVDQRSTITDKTVHPSVGTLPPGPAFVESSLEKPEGTLPAFGAADGLALDSGNGSVGLIKVLDSQGNQIASLTEADEQVLYAPEDLLRQEQFDSQEQNCGCDTVDTPSTSFPSVVTLTPRQQSVPSIKSPFSDTTAASSPISSVINPISANEDPGNRGPSSKDPNEVNQNITSSNSSMDLPENQCATTGQSNSHVVDAQQSFPMPAEVNSPETDGNNTLVNPSLDPSSNGQDSDPTLLGGALETSASQCTLSDRAVSISLPQGICLGTQPQDMEPDSGGTTQQVMITLDGADGPGTGSSIPAFVTIDAAISDQGPEAVAKEIDRLTNDLLASINSAIQGFNTTDQTTLDPPPPLPSTLPDPVAAPSPMVVQDLLAAAVNEEVIMSTDDLLGHCITSGITVTKDTPIQYQITSESQSDEAVPPPDKSNTLSKPPVNDEMQIPESYIVPTNDVPVKKKRRGRPRGSLKLFRSDGKDASFDAEISLVIRPGLDSCSSFSEGGEEEDEEVEDPYQALIEQRKAAERFYLEESKKIPVVHQQTSVIKRQNPVVKSKSSGGKSKSSRVKSQSSVSEGERSSVRSRKSSGFENKNSVVKSQSSDVRSESSAVESSFVENQPSFVKKRTSTAQKQGSAVNKQTSVDKKRRNSTVSSKLTIHEMLSEIYPTKSDTPVTSKDVTVKTPITAEKNTISDLPASIKLGKKIPKNSEISKWITEPRVELEKISPENLQKYIKRDDQVLKNTSENLNKVLTIEDGKDERIQKDDGMVKEKMCKLSTGKKSTSTEVKSIQLLSPKSCSASVEGSNMKEIPGSDVVSVSETDTGLIPSDDLAVPLGGTERLSDSSDENQNHAQPDNEKEGSAPKQGTEFKAPVSDKTIHSAGKVMDKETEVEKDNVSDGKRSIIEGAELQEGNKENVDDLTQNANKSKTDLDGNVALTAQIRPSPTGLRISDLSGERSDLSDYTTNSLDCRTSVRHVLKKRKDRTSSGEKSGRGVVSDSDESWKNINSDIEQGVKNTYQRIPIPSMVSDGDADEESAFSEEEPRVKLRRLSFRNKEKTWAIKSGIIRNVSAQKSSGETSLIRDEIQPKVAKLGERSDGKDRKHSGEHAVNSLGKNSVKDKKTSVPKSEDTSTLQNKPTDQPAKMQPLEKRPESGVNTEKEENNKPSNSGLNILPLSGIGSARSSGPEIEKAIVFKGPVSHSEKKAKESGQSSPNPSLSESSDFGLGTKDVVTTSQENSEDKSERPSSCSTPSERAMESTITEMPRIPLNPDIYWRRIQTPDPSESELSQEEVGGDSGGPNLDDEPSQNEEEEDSTPVDEIDKLSLSELSSRAVASGSDIDKGTLSESEDEDEDEDLIFMGEGFISEQASRGRMEPEAEVLTCEVRDDIDNESIFIYEIHNSDKGGNEPTENYQQDGNPSEGSSTDGYQDRSEANPNTGCTGPGVIGIPESDLEESSLEIIGTKEVVPATVQEIKENSGKNREQGLCGKAGNPNDTGLRIIGSVQLTKSKAFPRSGTGEGNSGDKNKVKRFPCTGCPDCCPKSPPTLLQTSPHSFLILDEDNEENTHRITRSSARKKDSVPSLESKQKKPSSEPAPEVKNTAKRPSTKLDLADGNCNGAKRGSVVVCRDIKEKMVDFKIEENEKTTPHVDDDGASSETTPPSTPPVQTRSSTTKKLHRFPRINLREPTTPSPNPGNKSSRERLSTVNANVKIKRKRRVRPRVHRRILNCTLTKIAKGLRSSPRKRTRSGKVKTKSGDNDNAGKARISVVLTDGDALDVFGATPLHESTSIPDIEISQKKRPKQALPQRAYSVQKVNSNKKGKTS